MHTSQQGGTDAFEVTVGGQALPAAELLGLEKGDRLGVVVTAPFGGLGAGLLVGLATAAYFDVAGGERRGRNLYPEIYLIHVGGPWGSHASFDFWPERKEIFAGNAVEALRAINAQGITHLAVPAGAAHEVTHGFRESEIAADRIRHCYLYHPSGQLADADVTIATRDAGVLWNFDGVLRPEIWLDAMRHDVETDATKRDASAEAVDFRRVIACMEARADEVDRGSDAWLDAYDWVSRAQTDGFLAQAYARLPLEQALLRLDDPR
jgi:hypothetical protein